MGIYGKNVKAGYYHVINKNKLRNDNKKLYYRSLLEKRFMEICDHSSNILEWGYEDIIIDYKKFQNIGTNKTNRYIIDFWIKKKVKGTIKEYLIEIKPYDFLSPPKEPKRKTKLYLEKVENYCKIRDKCIYASEFAKQNNMEFCIITEKDLY